MRGTRGIGGMLYPGECRQIFRGMSSNIPGNVTKHSGECPQTFQEMSRQTFWGMSQKFRGMSANIPGNVLKHSGECLQRFRGMSSNIPGNVSKHFGECRQTFRGMTSNIHCCLTMILLKGRLSKSTVGHLSLGRSFINLFHCLQLI